MCVCTCIYIRCDVSVVCCGVNKIRQVRPRQVSLICPVMPFPPYCFIHYICISTVGCWVGCMVWKFMYIFVHRSNRIWKIEYREKGKEKRQIRCAPLSLSLSPLFHSLSPVLYRKKVWQRKRKRERERWMVGDWFKKEYWRKFENRECQNKHHKFHVPGIRYYTRERETIQEST